MKYTHYVVVVYPNAIERKVAEAESFNHAITIADDLNRNSGGSIQLRHEVRMYREEASA